MVARGDIRLKTLGELYILVGRLSSHEMIISNKMESFRKTFTSRSEQTNLLTSEPELNQRRQIGQVFLKLTLLLTRLSKGKRDVWLAFLIGG